MTYVRTRWRELPCPHPREYDFAEKNTGLPWEELVEQGRIRYKYGLLCASCGTVDYYAIPGGPLAGVVELPGFSSHVTAISQSVAPHFARLLRCSKCGRHDLHPLDDVEEATCPRCEGRLSSDVIMFT